MHGRCDVGKFVHGFSSMSWGHPDPWTCKCSTALTTYMYTNSKAEFTPGRNVTTRRNARQRTAPHGAAYGENAALIRTFSPNVTLPSGVKGKHETRTDNRTIREPAVYKNKSSAWDGRPYSVATAKNLASPALTSGELSFSVCGSEHPFKAVVPCYNKIILVAKITFSS